MTTQTQTQNQNQNTQSEQQQILDLITREEFDTVLRSLVSDLKSQLKALKDKNERLQGEVDALKEFAAELRKQKEISDIRAEARNQVLRELGYEVQSDTSINNNNNHNNNKNNNNNAEVMTTSWTQGGEPYQAPRRNSGAMITLHFGYASKYFSLAQVNVITSNTTSG